MKSAKRKVVISKPLDAASSKEPKKISEVLYGENPAAKEIDLSGDIDELVNKYKTSRVEIAPDSASAFLSKILTLLGEGSGVGSKQISDLQEIANKYFEVLNPQRISGFLLEVRRLQDSLRKSGQDFVLDEELLKSRAITALNVGLTIPEVAKLLNQFAQYGIAFHGEIIAAPDFEILNNFLKHHRDRSDAVITVLHSMSNLGLLRPEHFHQTAMQEILSTLTEKMKEKISQKKVGSYNAAIINSFLEFHLFCEKAIKINFLKKEDIDSISLGLKGCGYVSNSGNSSYLQKTAVRKLIKNLSASKESGIWSYSFAKKSENIFVNESFELVAEFLVGKFGEINFKPVDLVARNPRTGKVFAIIEFDGDHHFRYNKKTGKTLTRDHVLHEIAEGWEAVFVAIGVENFENFLKDPINYLRSAGVSFDEVVTSDEVVAIDKPDVVEDRAKIESMSDEIEVVPAESKPVVEVASKPPMDRKLGGRAKGKKSSGLPQNKAQELVEEMIKAIRDNNLSQIATIIDQDSAIVHGQKEVEDKDGLVISSKLISQFVFEAKDSEILKLFIKNGMRLSKVAIPAEEGEFQQIIKQSQELSGKTKELIFEKLINACSSGNYHEFYSSLLCLNNLNINFADRSSKEQMLRAFLCACGNGYQEFVEALSNIKSFDCNAISEGYSGLFLAAHNGHEEIVDFLLAKKNAKVNLELKSGPEELTPLLAACRYGYENIVLQLLDVGANIRAATKNINKFQTGNIVKESSDPNLALADFGVDAFVMAANHGHINILKSIKAKHPEIKFESYNVCSSREAFFAKNPLAIAIKNDFLDMANYLIDVIEVPINQYFYFSCNEIACALQDMERADDLDLVKSATDEDIALVSIPLTFIAILCTREDMLELLIDSGADIYKGIDLENSDRETTVYSPLMYALKKGSQTVINKILDKVSLDGKFDETVAQLHQFIEFEKKIYDGKPVIIDRKVSRLLADVDVNRFINEYAKTNEIAADRPSAVLKSVSLSKNLSDEEASRSSSP